MVVLFSSGFPLNSENESELTATIDACNKANVAIYALDVRGLVATRPGSSQLNTPDNGKREVTEKPAAENLFGVAWSACYLGAIELAAGKKKITLPPDAAVDELGAEDTAEYARQIEDDRAL